MLSYFKYYIIKTQQARKSIVLKLCGYAAAFRPDVWGVWSGGPTSGRVLGVLGGVEISLVVSKLRGCTCQISTDWVSFVEITVEL